MKGIFKGIDWLSENTGKVFGWSLVVMMVIVLYEVIMRRLFASPTFWVFETTYMLWGAYLVMTIAWTHKTRGHIAIDTFSNRIPFRPRMGLHLVLYLMGFFWIGGMILGGWDLGWTSWQIGEHTRTPWGPPIYPLKFMLPIGFFILLLQAMVNWVRDLRTFIKGGV